MNPDEISQELAREYREVAALVCNDADILREIAKDPSMTADGLRAQINLFCDDKDKLISDPINRRRRYEVACLIYHAAANGMIRCDEVKP